MALYNYDEILQRLLTRLQTKSQIVDVDPGSIARTFCEVVSEEYAAFYDELDLNMTLGVVSTATGQFLDLIAPLVGATRLVNETDENFRARIVNQVYVVAGGNLTSIRLRVLSIDGVKDIVTKQYTKGVGSFSIYVLTDEIETPQSIINRVTDVVSEAKSYGVFAEVKAPILIPVELKVRLVFSDSVPDAQKASIRQIATQNIKTYIDNLGLGGTFSINEVLRSCLNANVKVADAEALTMKVNGILQFAKNFTVNWNERIVIDALEVI